METRLDRLFILLDTGSTTVIRKSAAAQLGQIHRLHPQKLEYLLDKILVLMRSKTWETRIAAGNAVEAIARNLTSLNEDSAAADDDVTMTVTDAEADDKLNNPISKFDIHAVLRDCASLLSADEDQFDTACVGLDDKEEIQRQKALLSKKLGLDGPAATEGLELFDESDLHSVEFTRKSAPSTPAKPVNYVIKKQLNTEGMSVREISAARRKAKLEMKRQASNSGVTTPSEKRIKSTKNVAVDQPGQPNKVLVDTVKDFDTPEEDEKWPFHELCEVLCNDLFSTTWETRHGAATLLREIVKQYGHSAGVTSLANAKEENQKWLEMMAVRLVCVLVLDRFGDYISDEVVAPVRETCAQALGTLCSFLSAQCVLAVVGKLSEVITHPTWEVRYGSILGLKYVIAVKQDLVSQFGSVWPALLQSINDEVDDVRAITATCLLSVVDKLPEVIPQQVDELIKNLWDALLELDDLTSSTHSIMAFLSALLTVGRLQNFHGADLVELTPRIWPFLYHNMSNVRKASLKMLNTVFTECVELNWLSPILLHCLRHIYQRCLLEPIRPIADLAESVWNSLVTHTSPDVLCQVAVPWFNMWVCLLMQPGHVPIDDNYILKANHHKYMNDKRSDHSGVTVGVQHISGPIQDKPEVRSEKVMYTRLVCSRCLGRLLSSLKLHQTSHTAILADVCRIMEFHLVAKTGTQRLCTGLVVSHWIQDAQEKDEVPPLHDLKQVTLRSAEESLYFDEVASLFTRLQAECRDFLACLKQQNVTLEHIYPPESVFTIELAHHLATSQFEQIKPTLKQTLQTKFSEHAGSLLFTVNQLKEDYSCLNMRVQLSLACALASLKCLPPKLNPVIRPLMETIKKEIYYFFQNIASNKLCSVLTMCTAREPCPNGKVFKNLCTSLCAYKKQTPLVESVNLTADDTYNLTCDTKNGILTLFTEQKSSESKVGAKRGPKPKKSTASVESMASVADSVPTPTSNSGLCAESIQYEGARNALWLIVSTLKDHLLNVLPTCTDHFLKPLQQNLAEISPQAIVNSLQVLQVIYEVLPESLKFEVLDSFNSLLDCVKSEYAAVRHMAARTVAACALSMTADFMNLVLDNILPLLGAAQQISWRQGSIETIYHIVDLLSVQCIPYLVLLVVPVLGRMTDQDLAIQMMASQCFASLITLMPLESSVPDPPKMKEHLLEKKKVERKFLEQLLNGKVLLNYGIPIPIKSDLRKYQQDGVNWLAFLNKYKLHGILCDDMGLGKTFQTICIMAGDHFKRQEKYKESQDVDSVPLPSLVVCPSTLCGHWVYEVEKFVDNAYLNTLNYSVLPLERMRLREEIKNHSLVVASYEIVRNDIDFLRTITWNYCVLDEGHIIKNSKSKTTQAVKKLNCIHRLILTGTPVQNNVLELWSLFDFLMPGYLGTERSFSSRYSRPILQSRDARSSSKDQEAGALAVESLHKQVLPFLLRRLKTDVLKDLPPKIIQDYYCDLSPLQAQLYMEFGQSSAGHVVEKSLTSMKDDSHEQVGFKGHIFQALQYLKKVCNHPALVIQNSQHPHHEKMMMECRASGKSITDIEYSGKLSALKQLLLDCGIGVTSNPSDTTVVVNQHRALIFCQLKMMIDIIEQELLKKCLPSVTYLRLDGSTPANSRQNVVHRFNDDPTIDLLLLTTTVGGLGLNLIGADTVIFIEHDWNPMKDLQAMDRAHRIGQTRVVNVYRLIAKHTLEEKIMGLQKFKLNIANTVVNQENSGLATMATDQLLDLFSIDNSTGKDTQTSGATPSKGLKTMLQGLTELWDESEYDSEYDVANFLTSLAKK